MSNKTKIFVDGNCVVCDIEISHYKRIAPDLFDIVDISSPEFDASTYGLTSAAVQKHLHVLTPAGELKIGVAAFQHIWSQIEKYKILAQITNLPIVNPLARLGYEAFAVIRPYLPKKRR